MKKIIFILSLLSCVIFLAESCNKTASGGSMSTNPSQALVYFSFLNLAPYSEPSVIFMNSSAVTSTMNPDSYQPTYVSFTPGTYTIQFQTVADSPEVQLTATSYDSGQFYTVYLYNPTRDSLAAFLTNDDYSQVSLTSTYVRFISATPDAPAVDVYFGSTYTQLDRTPTDNVTSAIFNLFQPLAIGNYVVIAKKTGTDSTVAVLNNSNPVNFFGGMAYTVFLIGKTDSLSLQILTEQL
jgi:hypothetical protein